ncbi:PLP-dependent aminotransferase family protein [Marinobacterium litorale]|uniref:aminotransferase-like domain-containing protein n=1 Tax=Marinobacterium litorale TaxID=404770 RepID=UPI0004144937|nr:PLP-dependent aminotransferase family protein [Marinobacterium litorale]
MRPSRYKQLVDRCALDIRSGKFPPGTQLPTHRAFASQEKIALVTATRVYAELAKMGLVSGEKGRGTFVKETRLPPGHGMDQQAVPSDTLDLNFNSPLLDGQTDDLREALKQLAYSGDLESVLHYQPHVGRLHERQIFARHLSRRGLRVDAHQLLVTSGAQHGLALACMTLLEPGDVVAVDELIYPGFKTVAQANGLELVPFSSNETGPDLNALMQLCRTRRVKAVYTMPTLHNPLGWVLSQSDREMLVSIARSYHLILIEDAAYAFHAASAPPPLASIAPERTLYISGFSKSIATGLRVGFLTAPTCWIGKLERAIRATTWNTPALMTALVARWVQDGTVSRLEEAKRADARARQEIAKKVFQDFHFIHHPNAYFLWLPLPPDARADRITANLLDGGISVSTAQPFATTSHTPQALRIALGSVKMSQLSDALIVIRDQVEADVYGLGAQ